MSLQIKIDTREPMLGALIGSMQHDNITTSIEPLDVGDVHIVFNNMVFLFERKTCQDMASSVKDGRYREQKMRMLAYAARQHHIFYMIEGMPRMSELLMGTVPVHGVKPAVLSGMVVFTMLRDGIHVVPVQSTEETAAWIWTIATKCLANPEKIAAQDGGAAQDYVGQIKVKKINNITPTNCYLIQLSQIPNISVSTAKEIAKVYPTMLGLLNRLTALESDEERIKCLSEIPMIGKKKAQNMLPYLLPSA